jgi:acetyl esterase/lipase
MLDPMLDPVCKKFLRILAMGAGATAYSGDVIAKRENFRKLMELAGGVPPPGIVTADGALPTPAGALPYRSYRRNDSASSGLPTCLFFHGGGFVAGSIETHDGICRTLADASCWQILSVGYRLAPQYTFPAPIDDGMAILAAVMAAPQQFGADPRHVAVAGDSVGAGLAACVAQQWRAREHPVALQVLICPALEAEPRYPSRREFARGFFIEDHMIASDFAAYRGSRDSLPAIFACADMGALPPAIIHVAGCDPFRDEGLAFGDALRQAGVGVEVTTHPGMLHLFHAFAKFIPAGDAALRRIGAQMRAHVETPRR